ncbi:hypothetical protein M1D88_13185 [Arthrobacter sp. R1-13]
MATEVSFRRVITTFALALTGGILLALLLKALFPQSGVLALAVPLGLVIMVVVPVLATYFKRRM